MKFNNHSASLESHLIRLTLPVILQNLTYSNQVNTEDSNRRLEKRINLQVKVKIVKYGKQKTKFTNSSESEPESNKTN